MYFKDFVLFYDETFHHIVQLIMVCLNKEIFSYIPISFLIQWAFLLMDKLIDFFPVSLDFLGKQAH